MKFFAAKSFNSSSRCFFSNSPIVVYIYTRLQHYYNISNNYWCNFTQTPLPALPRVKMHIMKCNFTQSFRHFLRIHWRLDTYSDLFKVNVPHGISAHIFLAGLKSAICLSVRPETGESEPGLVCSFSRLSCASPTTKEGGSGKGQCHWEKWVWVNSPIMSYQSLNSSWTWEPIPITCNRYARKTLALAECTSAEELPAIQILNLESLAVGHLQNPLGPRVRARRRWATTRFKYLLEKLGIFE